MRFEIYSLLRASLFWMLDLYFQYLPWLQLTDPYINLCIWCTSISFLICANKCYHSDRSRTISLWCSRGNLRYKSKMLTIEHWPWLTTNDTLRCSHIMSCPPYVDHRGWTLCWTRKFDHIWSKLHSCSFALKHTSEYHFLSIFLLEYTKTRNIRSNLQDILRGIKSSRHYDN